MCKLAEKSEATGWVEGNPEVGLGVVVQEDKGGSNWTRLVCSSSLKLPPLFRKLCLLRKRLDQRTIRSTIRARRTGISKHVKQKDPRIHIVHYKFQSIAHKKDIPLKLLISDFIKQLIKLTKLDSTCSELESLSALSFSAIDIHHALRMCKHFSIFTYLQMVRHPDTAY